MTRASRLLKRLVVVGASTAVIAGGALPLAEGVANAATGDNATAVTLSPHGATDTVNNCTPYTATVTPASNTTKFDLQISEPENPTTASGTPTTTIGFCDISGFSTTTYPNQNNSVSPTCSENGGQGSTAVCDAQLTADANGKVSFGLTTDTPGTMSIVAYDDVNGNNVYEAGVDTQLDSTSETWVANTATSVNCQPPSQTLDVNSTATVTCTPTTASGTSVNDQAGAAGNSVVLTYVVTAGPDKSQTNSCSYTAGTTVGSTNGQTGSWECDVLNGGTAGTDTIVVYADNNGNGVLDSGEPSQQVSATFVAASAQGTTVAVTCSPNPTTTDSTACQDPTTDNTANFTATVKDSSGNAVSGALVTWSASGGSGNQSLNPTSCTTGSNGQCGTVLTEPNTSQDETITVTGTVNLASGPPNTASGSATKTFHNPNPSEARNVTISPLSATQQPGGAQTFKATVTDRFGNPVQGACVGWTESGPGRFSDTNPYNCGTAADNTQRNFDNYTFDTTCITQADGTCTEEVTSLASETGTETVTADIATDRNSNYYYNSTTGQDTFAQECALPAATTYGNTTGGYLGDYANESDLQNTSTGAASTAPGAPAGNCTASGQVNWQQATTPPPPTSKAPQITSPAVAATQLGEHHHRIAGSGTPGDSLTLYRNGIVWMHGTVDSSGHFAFDPNVKQRSKFYVLDTSINKASNVVTIYVKVQISLSCGSPRAHELKCHLSTNPRLKHDTVTYRVTFSNTTKAFSFAGETGRRGKDTLTQRGLPSGHARILARVSAKSHVQHNTKATETRIRS